MFYCEWWSTTGSQRLLEEEASNGPGLDAGVPPFILVLSLFPLFFFVRPESNNCLALSLGYPWCFEGSNLIVGWAFSKVVDVENEFEQNPHQYFANAHFASLQQATWRHGSAKYLSRKCFGSNLFPSIKPLFGPSSNKGFAVSFKIFTYQMPCFMQY